ncbi:MAG TPA: WHG domain-containing protein [Pedococcus sp.]|jgi:AcrR family transcriptional regulator|nr:WHG domain-containing protein [Pedococcus sp.]
MTTAPTRRERQRQATYDEIVEVSRGLLRDGEDVSIRAVATAMGLTPPALYRYVDSHAELLSLVAQSVFEDVVASMGLARDAQAPDDPAAQIVAAATAFRHWAMTHRQEFQLVFASASTAETAQTESSVAATSAPEDSTNTWAALHGCPPGQSGGDLFAAFFGEIFGRLWERYRFPVPADADLDPEVLAVLESQSPPTAVTGGLGAATPGMIWMFERAWAKLYGTVTLEVFGHVHPVFISSGALFRAAMLDIGRELKIDAEWDRLQALAQGPL